MKKNLLICAAIVMTLLTLCSCEIQNTKTSDSSNEEAQLIADIPTTQYFTDEAVPDDDAELIAEAGINAPSAMNKQQWHFSVVTNKEILEQISEDMSANRPERTPAEKSENASEEAASDNTDAKPSDNAPEKAASDDTDSKPNDRKDGTQKMQMNKAGISDAPLAIVVSCAEGSEFDAGLACQNMSATANLLGYGTKIISSPVIALNGEKQTEYKEQLGIPEDQTAVAVLLVGKEDTSADPETDGYTGATQRNPFNDMVTYVE